MLEIGISLIVVGAVVLAAPHFAIPIKTKPTSEPAKMKRKTYQRYTSHTKAPGDSGAAPVIASSVFDSGGGSDCGGGGGDCS